MDTLKEDPTQTQYLVQREKLAEENQKLKAELSELRESFRMC
jgi:cell shape-determining protein MreC